MPEARASTSPASSRPPVSTPSPSFRSPTTIRSTRRCAPRACRARRVPIDGHVRANLTITDPAGVTTKLNLPGAALDAADRGGGHRRGRRRVARARAGWCSPDRCRRAPAPTSTSTSSRAVRAAHGGATRRSSPSTPRAPRSPQVVDARPPDLIKPNDEELAELAGAELDGGRRPRRRGARASPARSSPPSGRARRSSRSAPHGAVLITPTAPGTPARPAIRSSAPSAPATARSPGYLLAELEGASPEDRAAPSRPVRRGRGIPPRHPGARPATDLPPATCRSPTSPESSATPTMEVTVSQTITPELVSLDVGLGADKAAVIRALAARVVAQGRATDADALFADAWAREQKDETGLPGGIAIPHAKSAAVTEASLAFARLEPGRRLRRPRRSGRPRLPHRGARGRRRGAPRGALEARAQPHAGRLHERPARGEDERRRRRDRAQRDRRGRCRAQPPSRRLPRPRPRHRRRRGRPDSPSTDAPPASSPSRRVRPASRTPSWPPTRSPPQGKKLGIDLTVEPQGSSGYKAIPQSVIDDADAVIFATDVDVRELQRFAGKPVVRSGVKRGIEQPDADDPRGRRRGEQPERDRASPVPPQRGRRGGRANIAWGARIQRILLTGVSYMIPFVAGGGLLIALGLPPRRLRGQRRRCGARSSSTTRCGICRRAASASTSARSRS